MNNNLQRVSEFSESLVLPHELARCLTKGFEENNIKILKSTFTDEAIKFKIRFEHERKLLINKEKEYQTKATEAQRMKEERVLFNDMTKAVKAEIMAISRNFDLSITRDMIVIKVNKSKELSEMSKFYLTNYYNKILSLVVKAFKEVGIKMSLKQQRTS